MTQLLTLQQLFGILLLLLVISSVTTTNNNGDDKPISMKEVNELDVTEGKMLEFECDLVTDLGIPRYEWYDQDFKRLEEKQEELSIEANRLYIKANRKISKITCKIFPGNGSTSSEEETLKLNVYYPPTLKLQVISGTCDVLQNFVEMKAKQRCEFQCNVSDAWPKSHLIQFYLNENLVQNGSKNTYKTNSTERLHAGDYRCVAVNSVGNTTSNSLTLKVPYRPECRQQKKGEENRTIYYERINETLSISCNVTSYPEPTKYWWNTTDNLNTPTINYTLRSNSDRLQCWARNFQGKQEGRCDIDLRLASAHPDPVSDCNITEDLKHLWCHAGSNGGSTQHFIIEVLPQIESDVVPEKYYSFPIILPELVHNEDYNITVSSINAVGQTSFTLIQNKTEIISTIPAFFKDPKFVVPVIVIPLVVMVVLLTAYIIVKRWKTRNEGNPRENVIFLTGATVQDQCNHDARATIETPFINSDHPSTVTPPSTVTTHQQ